MSSPRCLLALSSAIVLSLGCSDQTALGIAGRHDGDAALDAADGSATNDSAVTTPDAAAPADAAPRDTRPAPLLDAGSDEGSERPQAAGCPTAGRSNTPTTVDGLMSALVGRWLLCSETGLTENAQAGLEITAGGRYVLLVRDGSGALIPKLGVDFEGIVYCLEPGIPIPCNFQSDLGGIVNSHPVITANPKMLIVTTFAGREYRYVAAP